MSIITGIRGCTFNSKHNDDIGLVMHSKSIESPPKKKIKETAPFMNGSYDFSTVGSNGEITYSERKITVIFGLPAETKEKLEVLYSKALEWLVDIGKSKLVFDVIKDYYFMAEVEETSSFEQTMEFGLLTVTFVADPFKSSIDYIGSNIWDTFNFEEDYLEESYYNVEGTDEIMVYNPGRTVRPIVYCSVPMTLIQKGKSYTLSPGDNKIYGFYLTNGKNNLTITGNGIMNFLFRKESL